MAQTEITPVTEPFAPDQTETDSSSMATSITPVTNEEPIPQGWEHDFAATNPTLYAAGKTALDLLPFGWAVTPSGRRQFESESGVRKAVTLSLDVLGLAGTGMLGKSAEGLLGEGLKLMTTPARTGFSKLMKSVPWTMKKVEEVPSSFFDNFTKDLDVFEAKTQTTGLATKYGIASPEEIKTVLSGDKLPESASEELKALYNKKGNLHSDVKKDLDLWSQSPSSQRLNYATNKWQTLASTQVKGTAYSLEKVFTNQAVRVFGPEKGILMSLGTVGNDDLDLLLKDAFLNQTKIMRGIDSNIFSYLDVPRKVFGKGETRYGTYSRIYKPAVAMLEDVSKASLQYGQTFQGMLASKGVGKVLEDGTFKNFFTPSEWDEAGKLISKFDLVRSSGGSQEMINSIFNETSEPVQRITKAVDEFHDYLYQDDIKHKLLQIADKAGLSDYGRTQFNSMITEVPGKNNLFSRISDTFSAENGLRYEAKYQKITGILDEVKTALKDNTDWYTEYDVKTVNNLMRDLSYRKGGATRGLPDYLENYSKRIYEDTNSAGKAFVENPKSMTAGYVKGRTNLPNEGELVTDLGTMLSRRIREQAKSNFAYPVYNEIMKVAETLPENLRTFTEHYMDRVLGRNSKVDEKVADMINKYFGVHWDAGRVKQLSMNINNLIYTGGIGFKPFSAARNYIQPFLTTPADMGGIKDFLWLAKGLARAFKPGSVSYMRDIGVITEFTPDLLIDAGTFDVGKSLKLFGKEMTIPSMRAVRDAGLWMFKNSETHTRTWAGCAALEKWEYYAKKFASIDTEGKAFMSADALDSFKSKLNLNSRESWVRADIERYIRTGSAAGFDEAKKIWIRDVVADSQFLYGVADSPLVTQVGGIFTRSGLVFQSWWMHYGSLLAKWMTRTGDVPQTTQRMFTWMLSSGVAGAAMTPLWGKSVASQSVYTGPLPLDPDLPVTFKPFVEGIKSIVAAGGIPFGLTSTEQMKNRIKATINTSMIFVPGGLEMKKLYNNISKEGFEKGFAKGITGYNP
jgi:hypothetical protein